MSDKSNGGGDFVSQALDLVINAGFSGAMHGVSCPKSLSKFVFSDIADSSW